MEETPQEVGIGPKPGFFTANALVSPALCFGLFLAGFLFGTGAVVVGRPIHEVTTGVALMVGAAVVLLLAYFTGRKPRR